MLNTQSGGLDKQILMDKKLTEDSGAPERDIASISLKLLIQIKSSSKLDKR